MCLGRGREVVMSAPVQICNAGRIFGYYSRLLEEARCRNTGALKELPPPQPPDSAQLRFATTVTLLLSPLSLFFWAFVTLFSRHPLRATLTCCLGCSVGRVCCPPPLFLFAWCLHPSSFPICSYFLHTTPFTNNLGECS